MLGDQLLQEWKLAKQTCKKIIDISIQSNIYKKPTQRQSSQQFMRVYDVVYRLCSNSDTEQNRTPMVYRDYQQILKTSLITMSKELLHERDIYRLGMLRKIYDAYEDALKRLRHMFAYLNRPYNIKEGKIEDLDKTGASIIVTTLFTQESLLEYDTIYFKQLAKVRKNKDLTDCNILKQYVQILFRFHLRLTKKQSKNSRTLYTDFQHKYLQQCKEHYSNLFQKLQQLSPSEYFIEVNNLYQFQKRISEECFGSSDSFINRVFAGQFLEEYRGRLMEGGKGLKYILQNRELQVINFITSLYKKLTNSIDGFRQPFQAFIYQQICSILQQVSQQLLLKKTQNTYITFLQKLIKKNTQLLHLLQTSFMKYSQFSNYYKSGVERAFSKTHLPVPIEEMLATYVDVKFRVPYGNQDAMKEDVRNVKAVFQCLEHKDLFLVKYMQKLAKRVLALTPQSLESHENLVYHIKLYSGDKLAQNLQSLLDEYKLSLQPPHEYRQYAQKLPYNMTLTIFTEQIWPFKDIIEFKSQQLPELFRKGYQCVKLYQTDKMNKKNLKISLQDCRIRWIYYFEKQVENKFAEAYFDTNGLQGLLLYYIYMHRPEEISLSILASVYPQIKPAIIKQCLAKMCQSSQTLIIRSQQPQSQPMYKFNPLMKSKKRIIQYDTPVEQQQQQQHLFQKNELTKQREYVIDSNIAKLMKTKKVYRLEQILEEVPKMVKVFNPAVKDMKNSIERLLVRDVIVRDQKDRNVIKYKE